LFIVRSTGGRRELRRAAAARKNFYPVCSANSPQSPGCQQHHDDCDEAERGQIEWPKIRQRASQAKKTQVPTIGPSMRPMPPMNQMKMT